MLFHGTPAFGALSRRLYGGTGDRFHAGSPTLADGETWRDVREARADVDTLAQRGLAYEHLDQLALEYLYGVR